MDSVRLTTPSRGEVEANPEDWCDSERSYLWSISGLMTPADMIALGWWLQAHEAEATGNDFDNSARSLFEAAQGRINITILE